MVKNVRVRRRGTSLEPELNFIDQEHAHQRGSHLYSRPCFYYRKFCEFYQSHCEFYQVQEKKA